MLLIHQMREKDRQTIQKINKIGNPEIRDLLWLIYSPQIVPSDMDSKMFFSFNGEGEFEVLLEGLKIVEPIEEPLGFKRYPLGKYAESLIAFYLERNPFYELKEKNLQLIRENQTLGELDFLFFHASQLIHLEFAIKFYLKFEDEGQSHFLGPNAKDKLANKVRKLLDHQCQLATAHPDLLPKSLQVEKIVPKLMIKGVLFLPWREYEKSEILNEGWWLRIKELSKLGEVKNKFGVLKKREWIYSFYPDAEMLDFTKLQLILKNLLQLENAVMLVRYDENLQPLDRGFVVNNNWPNNSKIR